MRRDLRNWLDQILRTRPQSVAIPDQSLGVLAYRKISNELRDAGYRAYGGYVHNDNWIFELPHPARRNRDSFRLTPFSPFDRRWKWDPATQSLQLDGPWMAAYSFLDLRTTLDDPTAKSYCRPWFSGISAAEIEAFHRVRYFEDTNEHAIFGRYALVDPRKDELFDYPSWCLVEASSAELIRDASPLIKRELDDGTKFVIRPMKGYWFIQTVGDACERLMTKFGLSDAREAISSGELSPDEAWAFELCEAWFQAHPRETTIGPLDSEEAYSRGFLRRPTHGFAEFGKRVAELVKDGPPSRRQKNDEKPATAPSSKAAAKKASAKKTTAKKASAKKASAKKTEETRSLVANSQAQMEEVGADSPEVEKDWILQLERLGSLFERGLLSEDEFETQKQRLLRQTDKPD